MSVVDNFKWRPHACYYVQIISIYSCFNDWHRAITKYMILNYEVLWSWLCRYYQNVFSFYTASRNLPSVLITKSVVMLSNKFSFHQENVIKRYIYRTRILLCNLLIYCLLLRKDFSAVNSKNYSTMNHVKFAEGRL